MTSTVVRQTRIHRVTLSQRAERRHVDRRRAAPVRRAGPSIVQYLYLSELAWVRQAAGAGRALRAGIYHDEVHHSSTTRSGLCGRSHTDHRANLRIVQARRQVSVHVLERPHHACTYQDETVPHGDNRAELAPVPRINPAYGPLRVTAIHAFVSNNDLGPEYSAQASTSLAAKDTLGHLLHGFRHGLFPRQPDR